MSNIKVSELESGSYIGSTDILYISQDTGTGLVSRQVTLDDIQRSFDYSVIKQDMTVYYSDTYTIGNSSGATFNSLYLGSGILGLGGQSGSTLYYHTEFDGTATEKDLITNKLHIAQYVGTQGQNSSGITINHTSFGYNNIVSETLFIEDLKNSGRGIYLFEQVVPLMGDENTILARNSDNIADYSWNTPQQVGLATTGSNTFHGAQNITGSLSITGLTAGSFGDSAVVINPTTHVVGTMPQGLRTTYGLFSQTGNSITVSGTTTESTLIDGGVGTLSVPANGFSIGDSFRGDMGGIINTNNNETIRIRVKSGNVILADSGVQNVSNVSNNVFTLSLNFIIRNIGAAGTASIVSIGRFSYNKTVNGTIEGFSFNTVNNTTFDTTITNTLNVTIQFGSNSTNNNIYTDIFTLNKIY